MSAPRHAWAYRDGLPANVTACSNAGCPWLCRTDANGRGAYRHAHEGRDAWQPKTEPCAGTRPPRAKRRSRVGERRTAQGASL